MHTPLLLFVSWKKNISSPYLFFKYFRHSVRRKLFGENSNYRLQGRFEPPVLHVSKSFEERNITQ